MSLCKFKKYVYLLSRVTFSPLLRNIGIQLKIALSLKRALSSRFEKF